MAAPKGNKFALGNKGGKPPIYSTPEELETKLSAYFDYCIEEGERLTVTGLALYLGFASVQSLTDQEKRSEEYSCLVKRAKTVIMMEHEERLSSTTPTGSIFWLKNFGWTDRTEIDHLNNGNSFNTLTDAELVNRLNQLLASRDQK